MASSKKLRGEQLKSAKSKVARLKKLGLYKGDARKHPTDYALRQTRKYKDVLDKKAQVVTVPSRKAAREYTEVFRTKYRKVVIPKRQGERFYYSKKSGEVFSYNREYGKQIRRIFPKKPLTEAEAANLPKGRNIRFAIPIGTGSGMRRMRFADYAELKAYMSSDSLRGYNNWQRYVEIEEILGDEPLDDEDED